jgi:hypothetical protein
VDVAATHTMHLMAAPDADVEDDFGADDASTAGGAARGAVTSSRSGAYTARRPTSANASVSSRARVSAVGEDARPQRYIELLIFNDQSRYAYVCANHFTSFHFKLLCLFQLLFLLNFL